ISGTDIDADAQLKKELERRMTQFELAKNDPIYTALRTSPAQFDYNSEDEVIAEIKVRQHISDGITLIEDHANYDHGGDSLRLGNKWDILPGITGDDEDATSHVFKPKAKASDAIKQIFSTDDNLLECNTATVAVHYRALMNVMGAEAFDRDLGPE
ncbi:MAG: hypothetical protein DMF66_17325, partial [Acidobacteria bacterium]